MFRILARDVILQRTITRTHAPISQVLYRPRHPYNAELAPRSFTRLISSSPSPSPEKSSSSVAPPIAATKDGQRKPKLQLRPAPKKVQSSPSAIANATSNSSKPSPEEAALASSTAPSVTTVKELTKRDIVDAENHGVLSPPPPGSGWIASTLHKTVQLVKFYWRGVKLIITRREEILKIRARVFEGGAPVSRWENRMIRTQKDDINKLIPFLLVALVLEEIIPLIALYAPFVLPSTCVLPSQQARIDEKASERAMIAAANSRHILAKLTKQGDSVRALSLDAIRGRETSTAICRILGLSSLGLGFDAVRIRRIRRHLQFIGQDDLLISQDNLVGCLSEGDLDKALRERGIILQGLSLEAKEDRLARWMASVQDVGPDDVARRLFLVTMQH